MSHGSPCMVEIYDQDNWVLFMLDSHRAEACDRVLGSVVRNVVRMLRLNDLNEFAICRKEVLLLQNLKFSHETKIVANRGTSLIRLSYGR